MSVFRRLTLLLVSLSTLRAAENPNIVIILTDDMGWKDVGYHGAEFPTPNIDRIAREGVEPNRFYVTSLCASTQAGLPAKMKSFCALQKPVLEPVTIKPPDDWLKPDSLRIPE